MSPFVRGACLTILAIVAAVPLRAQAPASAAPPGQPSVGELAKQLANPVASLVSVPFQSNCEFGVGPEEKTTRWTLRVALTLLFPK